MCVIYAFICIIYAFISVIYAFFSIIYAFICIVYAYICVNPKDFLKRVRQSRKKKFVIPGIGSGRILMLSYPQLRQILDPTGDLTGENLKIVWAKFSTLS
jgi:hypothetical protein